MDLWHVHFSSVSLWGYPRWRCFFYFRGTDSPFLFTWTTACLLVRSLQLKNHLSIESDRDHFGCYGFKIDFPLKLDLHARCKYHFAKIF